MSKDAKALREQLQAAGCDVLSGDEVKKPGKRRGECRGQRSLFEDRGQGLGNTGPGNSKPRGDLFPGGEDTAHVSLYVAWASFESMTKHLEEKRKLAQTSDEGSVVFRREGVSFVVHPNGKRRGPIFFNWCIKCEGVTLFIRNCA